ILSVSSSPSDGFRKGIVINTESAAAAIRTALSAAREQSGTAIREALVSISGNHIQTTAGNASIIVSGKTISQDDIDKVIDAAGDSPVNAGREIIHVLPTDFVIDSGRRLKDPLGIPGSRLEAKVNIVSASTEPLQRLVASCEKAGLQVADLVLQSIASAESALSAEDREMGTVLVDIGGGTTDIVLFKDGWLQHAAVLGIGGNHFTNDLSVGLRVPFAEAERLKKQYGLAFHSGDYEEIDVISNVGHGEAVKKVSRKLITDILRLRAEELLELIKEEMDRTAGHDAVTGAVFTGGGVLVPSFERLAENIISMPVRIGYPCLSPKNLTQQDASVPPITGVQEQFNSPEYAAGIGMVLYGAGVAPGRHEASDGGLFTKMTGLFRNIIGRRK
ncbi:MAG TPA: cell division protein FtsA, partial [Dissulfurispiraceae bacterium]|nr:cell division protein FtsA [Dissulfurispiraceae bacterium]